MRNVRAILRRELIGSFGQPIALVALAVFLGAVALFTLWFDDVFVGGVASMRRPFAWMSVCLAVFAPAVTMRAVADERRTGTLHVLATMPVTSFQIIVAKWLAAVILVAIALGLTLTWPLALAWFGDLDPGPVLAGYLGLFLAGSAMAAVGVAASSSTESQVSAFLLAVVATGLPWLVGYALPLVPRPWLGVVNYLTFEYHFANLAVGVLDSRSIVFFASVTALGLRFATHALEQRRLA